MIQWLVAIAAALAFSPAAAATPSAAVLPPALARALYAYNEATVHNDIQTLSGLVTDDYVLVNSDASVQGKSSYLTDFAVPGFKIDPYTIEQPFYRVRGDAALTGGTMELAWTQQGRHDHRHLRIAHFWVKHDGRWRIAYTQLTRIAE